MALDLYVVHAKYMVHHNKLFCSFCDRDPDLRTHARDRGAPSLVTATFTSTLVITSSYSCRTVRYQQLALTRAKYPSFATVCLGERLSGGRNLKWSLFEFRLHYRTVNSFGMGIDPLDHLTVSINSE